MSEFWDIYDINRNFTGRTVERGKPMKSNEYHIVVEAIIRNSKGEFLISKRSSNKHFPLMWEFTGGSVLAGESSYDGAIREAYEELGVDLSKSPYKLFASGIRQFRSFPDFNDIWLFEFDCDINDIKLCEGETCDAMWATPQKIREMIAKKEFVEYSEFNFVDKLLGL